MFARPSPNSHVPNCLASAVNANPAVKQLDEIEIRNDGY